MARLKVYQWEWTKFPIQQKTYIKPEYRIQLTQKLCKYFGIEDIEVNLCKRNGGGTAYGHYKINLPIRNKKCSIGLIYHEIAHAVNSKNDGMRGHTGTFKRNLIKVYIESKHQLKHIFAEIKKEQQLDQENYLKILMKEAKRSEQKTRIKEYKKSAEYRIDHLEKRIKRLESRKKRIETLLKSANRSKSALMRNKKEVQLI